MADYDVLNPDMFTFNTKNVRLVSNARYVTDGRKAMQHIIMTLNISTYVIYSIYDIQSSNKPLRLAKHTIQPCKAVRQAAKDNPRNRLPFEASREAGESVRPQRLSRGKYPRQYDKEPSHNAGYYASRNSSSGGQGNALNYMC